MNKENSTILRAANHLIFSRREVSFFLDKHHYHE